MLIKTNTVRSRHLFLSIEQYSILGACFMWRNAELEVHKTVLLGKGKPNLGSSFFFINRSKNMWTVRSAIFCVCCVDRSLRSKNVPERNLSSKCEHVLGHGVNTGCHRCFYIAFNNTFYYVVLIRSFIKEWKNVN